MCIRDSFCSGQVSSFVEDHLKNSGFDESAVSKEISQLKGQGIVSMEVLKQLTDEDWHAMGLSVGGGRVLKNALEKLRAEETLAADHPPTLKRSRSRSQTKL
eukprot:TRINITY_DN2717_c0_g1_i15.p2 TRINITY_DN2717_c0_g1~~TRINITY_DN2717_c0_g1_i15.p2  ORF type:complete len:102 (+),score=38.97 TRINITY_DN2717_c0_g1_i15:162-467(+)